MATGNTPTDKTQVSVDYSSLIKDYYISELNTLIKENHSFVAFLVISSGIEFLGKAISAEMDLFKEGNSKDDFKNALDSFPSLNKYSSLGLSKDKKGIDKTLYDIVRCGIVHSTSPKTGITLSEDGNDLPSVVGLADLAKDFNDACQDLLSGKIPMGKGKTLSDPIWYISDK